MVVVREALRQLSKLEEQQRDIQELFDKTKKSCAEQRLLLEKLARCEEGQADGTSFGSWASAGKAATMASLSPGQLRGSSWFPLMEAESPSTMSRIRSPHSSDSDDDYSEDTSYEERGAVARAFTHLVTGLRRWSVELSRNLLEDVAIQRANDFTPRNPCQRCLLPIVHNILFDFFAFTMIIASFILMAVELNFLIQHALDGEIVDLESRRFHGEPVVEWEKYVVWLRIGDVSVLIWFVIEVTLRLLAEQLDFFLGPNKIWNIGDLMITTLSTFYTLRDLCSPKLEVLDRLRFARIFRVIRAVHMIRMLKPFRRLRVMLYSICACLTSLAWGTFLLFLLISIAAIYLEDVALFHVQMHNRNHTEHYTDEEWKTIKDGLQENWGCMYDAQLSLLYSVTGGADWKDMAKPFCDLNPLHCFFYSSWVILIIFGLINITVGIFAREAQQFVQWDPQLIVEGAHSDHEVTRDTLRKLFDKMDISENKVLSHREIKKGLEDPFVKAYFAQLNIDIEMNPDQFFRLLDDDKNDRVDIDEFVKVCMRLQGGAKPLELQRILSELQQVAARLINVERQIEHQIMPVGFPGGHQR